MPGVQPSELGSCPLQTLIRGTSPAGRAEERGLATGPRIKRWLRRRLGMGRTRRLKRFLGAVMDVFQRKTESCQGRDFRAKAASVRLEAGDLVRVRTKAEIESTLGRWRALKGCAFLPEMEAYCGTTQHVFKRVERFIDERDFRLKKASGVVLLENLICSGTGATGRCDRACFFFWREEWLEKLVGG